MHRLELVLLTAMGCLHCGTDSLPNGKNHVLHFERVPANMPVAEGMQGDLVLPNTLAQLLVGEAGMMKQYAPQFEGTTIDVSADGAIRVIHTELRPERGHVVRYECLDGSSGHHEIQVRVRANGRERYADAFNVTCARADELKIETREPHQIVGSEFSATVSLLSRGEMVGGYGVVIADANGPIRSEHAVTLLDGPTSMLFRAAVPGSNARLAGGGLTATIPLDVVADGEWTLDLSTTTEAGGFDRRVNYEAKARFKDGSAVVIDTTSSCTVSMSPNVALTPPSGCRDSIAVTAWPTQICATLRTVQGCAPVSP